MAEAIEKRRVALGITGSAAAYRSAELAYLLKSRGYQVRAVMTNAATHFISPHTFHSITGNRVITDFWSDTAVDAEVDEPDLARWAEVFVIAPASADALAKLNAGFSDNPLLAMALTTKAPIILAPGMSDPMYHNPRTQETVAALRARGVVIVEPDQNDEPSGWDGQGRMASPYEIFYNIRRVLSPQDYAGKRVVVTAGPTKEVIDPLRFVSNRSSGKLGVALACEAHRRGANVTLIHTEIPVKAPGAVRRVAVSTAAQLTSALNTELSDAQKPADLVIMAAAVADFRPLETHASKLPLTQSKFHIEVEKTPDILGNLGSQRGTKKSPLLVGFATETGELETLLEDLRSKMHTKKVDMMVGNLAEAPHELDADRVWIIDRHGHEGEVSTTYKSRLANRILDSILKL